jgi:hypothetical protein
MTLLALAISFVGLVAQGLAASWWLKASRSIPDNFAPLAALNVSATYSKRAAMAQSVAAAGAFMVWLMTVLG